MDVVIEFGGNFLFVLFIILYFLISFKILESNLKLFLVVIFNLSLFTQVNRSQFLF